VLISAAGSYSGGKTHCINTVSAALPPKTLEHWERKWRHLLHAEVKIFQIYRVRVLLKHMKMVRKKEHPITGTLIIRYDGWCPVPSLEKGEMFPLEDEELPY